MSACGSPREQSVVVEPGPTPKSEPPLPVASAFAYPLADGRRLTPQRDAKDDWYVAREFGEESHLGEDWNGNGGGDTDCGREVFAIGAGRVVFSGDAGPGWGNVMIVEHRLPDDTRVESLYGHLRTLFKQTGDQVALRDKIGEVGNANGRYFCHLHLELRTSASRDWHRAGGGYSDDKTGWLDASEFIDARFLVR